MKQKNHSQIINLYLMGYRGLKSLFYFIENKKTHLLCSVCVARDPNLLCDYVDDILEICKNNKIKVFF